MEKLTAKEEEVMQVLWRMEQGYVKGHGSTVYQPSAALQYRFDHCS